ncbi:MAG: hypothetical protein ACFBZ8_05700 [Opitutales bacterium]
MKLSASKIIFASTLLPIAAMGTILEKSGQLQYDLTPGTYEVSGAILAFDEQQDFLLTEDLLVDQEMAPAWDGLEDGKIAAGTYVSSHYFYLKDDSYFGLTSASGSVTFDGLILGVIYQTPQVWASDAILGLDGVAYPEHGIGGSSTFWQDAAEMNTDPNGLTLNMHVNRYFGTGGYDALRVITLSNKSVSLPEPSTWAFLGGFLALVGVSVWRKRRAQRAA